MDAFEEKYATGEGRVLFRDKIPVPRWFLPAVVAGAVLGGGVLAVVGFSIPAALAWIVVGGTVGFIGNLTLMGLRIVVSDGGVEVYVGVRRHRFAFGDIVRTEQAEMKHTDYLFGRGQVKRNLKGDRAFVGGASLRGVKLHLKNGRHVFVSTNDPAGFEQAIARATAPTPRVRVDAGEPAVHEEEIVDDEAADRRQARR